MTWKKTGLPSIRPTWTWVSKGKTGWWGLPSLASGPKGVWVPWALAARKASKISDTVNQAQVGFAAVLDYTASTTWVIEAFRNNVARMVSKPRQNIKLLFTPAVFKWDPYLAEAWKQWDTNFFNTQNNSAGNTNIISWLRAAMSEKSPEASTQIYAVLTDDPANHDTEYWTKEMKDVVREIKVSDSLLLVIVDLSDALHWLSFEEVVETYREWYGELWDNLMIIEWATDPNTLIDAFIQAKAKATKSWRSSVTTSNLPEILSGGKGGNNLQIATGWSNKILRIWKG